MNQAVFTTWNAWLRIVLILVGLCCSVGETAAEGSKKRTVSEDAMGFGEGGGDPVVPLGERGRSNPRAPAQVAAPPVQTIQPVPSATSSGNGGKNFVQAQEGQRKEDNGPGLGGGVDTSQVQRQLMSMSREDLFQKIFQKPLPPRLRDMVVQLRVDNENLEQVRIHWDSAFEDFRFRSSRLKSYLESVLLPQGALGSPGFQDDFSGKGLKEQRFEVQLDETEFVLKLVVPPEYKKRSVRNLDETEREMTYGERIEPAIISAYLNVNTEEAWSYRERFFQSDSARLFWQSYSGSPEPERQPWNSELEGALRVWDWVLMGSGNLQETSAGQKDPVLATRQETKLVHDFVPWNSRLTLLDVTPRFPGGNFSLPALLGVDLDLGNALYSRKGSEKAKVDVFLSRAAGVTVYVNGDPVRTMQMGSGAQTIEGVPGRPGHNAGEVVITYADGKVERVPFEFTQSASEVLAEGLHEGSFSAGMRRIGSDNYGTTSGDLLVAGSYQRGWSPFVNQKAGLAVSRGLQVASLDLLLIEDSVTSWNLSSTQSLDSSLDWGQRYELQYALKMPKGSLLGRVSYTQSHFRNSFYTPITRRTAAVETGLNVSRALWKGILSSDLSVQFNRKIDSTTNSIDYRWSLGYSLQAYKGLNLRALAGFSVSSGEYSPSASFTANYFFNVGRHSFYAVNQTANQKRYVAPRLEQSRRRDSLLVGGAFVLMDRDSSRFIGGSYENAWRNQSTAGWSWSQGVGMVGGKSISLAGSVDPDQYGLQFNGQRTFNFADFGASYNLTDQSRQDIMSRSHYAVGRMSTSLMFADGVFAVGRPVREGFLLVKGRQGYSGSTFRINPSDQNASEYSRGGVWNAASYGMMSAYQTENVQIAAEHAPGTVSMEGNQFHIENTYQQGYVLRLGKPAQVFLRLRLIDQASLPLKHTTFQVFSVMDSAVALYRSFSNDDGVIQIGGLEAGKTYILRFGEDAFVKDLRITIPKSASRMLDLGDVKVENQSLSQMAKVSMLIGPELQGALVPPALVPESSNPALPVAPAPATRNAF